MQYRKPVFYPITLRSLHGTLTILVMCTQGRSLKINLTQYIYKKKRLPRAFNYNWLPLVCALIAYQLTFMYGGGCE